MILSMNDIEQNPEWKESKIALPTYDCRAMAAYTKEHPVWLHFGAGNIFRGFIASLQQRLLSAGRAQSGIIAADTYDFDMITRIYDGFDNLTLSVGLKADGGTVMEVIGSVAEAIRADSTDAEAFERLKEIARNPELQMMSFTITEKGYALCNMQQELLPLVASDMKQGPAAPQTAMSMVTSLLYERFLAGAMPIAMCSMDNCSHNGAKLQSAVTAFAQAWQEEGFVPAEFLSYISDTSKVTFPWSMIDKITPRPSSVIKEKLTSLGIANMEPVITDKNTYIAPFVNAEIPQYLVMEDTFPNGRPALEEVGVYMTDRDTVNRTERMKVTTCLNPLHTAMAVFGCLLGYDHIAKEMQDADIRALVESIGYKEGLPVVCDPQIIHPEDFIKEVLEERLVNPNIPDMPQRIATDTSMKIPIRFGETIKSYLADPDRDVRSLIFIPLAIAGWFRYLLGVDDSLQPMEVSADPMREELQSRLREIKVGQPETYTGELRSILRNTTIFAVDLCDAGLAETIESMFVDMIAEKGAVRKTLHKYCSGQ